MTREDEVEANGESLVDPEPFSVLLMALGAAGSVASLVSYIEDRLRARDTERNANRFAIRDAIMGAETALNELRGLVRSLEIVFVTGSQRHGNADPMMSLAGFGSVGLTFTREGYERWREVEGDVIVAATRIQRHLNDLLRHFASTSLRLRGHVAEHLQRTTELLNTVVRSLHQIHFAELFRSLETVIGECADVMRNLRSELEDLLR
jgi:hypothetical protein